MELKKVAIICGAACALGYFTGKYTTKPEVRTVVQVQKEIEVQEKVRTITKIVEHKDGSKETIIEEDKEKNTQTDIIKNKEKIVDAIKGKSNLSLLVGIQPKLFGGVSLGDFNLGLHYQTQPVSFIPVTLGVWGLAIPTPTVGVSLGWNY